MPQSIKNESIELMKDGTLSIGGAAIIIPSVEILKEIGSGANATVFEAKDVQLERRVAIKVWNDRGIRRAWWETRKIANLNHPLIVTTFSYGEVSGRPFAVMEMVDGISVKKWLLEDRHINERISVWEQYSRALAFIHRIGAVHGDPHTGNLIVYPDVYTDRPKSSLPSWSVKVADAGTSEFWCNPTDIQIRESKLICETAERLFHDQDIPKLWYMSRKWPHSLLIEVIDKLCAFIAKINGFGDWDRRSALAMEIVDMIADTPLFDLDEVIEQVRKTGFTAPSRVISRLNQKFLHLRELGESEMIQPETRHAYAAYQKVFIDRRLGF